MILRNIYFKSIAGKDPPRLMGFVPESVRQAAQELCDTHTCDNCPLNRPGVWAVTDCRYLTGCLTGQCEVCEANKKAGRDTYIMLKDR